MQKKIYSLFLVPCSLALCLALVFLMSCGDDKEDPPPPPPSSSSSSFQHPPNKNDSRVHVDGLDTLFNNNVLIVIGDVEFHKTYGADKTVISSIIISMRNMETDEITPIELNASYWGENYTLADGQRNNGPNFGPTCKFKGKYRIYIYVYLDEEEDPDEIAKIDSLTFEKSHPDCRTDYSLKFEYPRGGGSVELEPKKEEYAKGDRVKLIPKPTNGYAFYNWYIDHDYISTNPYTIEITADKVIKVNFVESRDFTHVSGPEHVRKDGFILNNAVKFTGSMFESQGGAKIIENFQSPDNEIDDVRNSDPLDITIIPANQVSKTHQFRPAIGPREDEIGYNVGSYFVVESAGNKYLLLSDNQPPVCTQNCTYLTIWKY